MVTENEIINKTQLLINLCVGADRYKHLSEKLVLTSSTIKYFIYS